MRPVGTGSQVVSTAVLQTDGKLIVGGGFAQVNGSTVNATTGINNFTRLNIDGSRDTAFNTLNSVGLGGANNSVFGVTLEADGSILLAGQFTAVNGTARNHLALLANDSITQNISAPSSSQLVWTRSGASAELIYAKFDVSLDSGTTWTPLGTGTRIGNTSNWQLTGLSLPANAQIRARGRTASGEHNGSSGLIEQVASIILPSSPIGNWRTQYFGSSANSGNAASAADPDGDGLPNLTEYAFGLDPTSGGSATLPQATVVGTTFCSSFAQPVGVSGITYHADWSPDLINWFAVPDTGSNGTHTFCVPQGTNTAMFMRYWITEP